MSLMTHTERKKIYDIIRLKYKNAIVDIKDIKKIINNVCTLTCITDKDLVTKYICGFICKKDKQYILSFSKDREPDTSVINLLIDDIYERRAKIVRYLKNIKYPDQRTFEWFEERKTRITASDCGTVLDMNEYEDQFMFIIKKITNVPFKGNIYCYHGKKYEKIASMIYEDRYKVNVANFGMVKHQIHSFLGASPDGIVDEIDKNGNKTKLVGRMIEIKCPLTRKIRTTGKDICPLHYWIQVQIQLEVCNLDECDFWQCSIYEYTNRNEFIADTNEETNKSLKNGLEKGCLIQLVKLGIGDYKENIYDHATFLYPDKLNMSIEECDKWILEQIHKVHDMNYAIDKVIYWRLDLGAVHLIKRDRVWFNKQLETFTKVWNYVLYFRTHEAVKDKFIKYVNKLLDKNNEEIMKLIERIYNDNTHEEAMKEIDKVINESIENDGYIPFD